MDAYSGYNQIQINMWDAHKKTFTMNKNNYYEIGHNLEVYLDDMVSKTPKN